MEQRKLRWKAEIESGEERSPLAEWGGRRWRGAIAGGGERSQVEGSDRRRTGRLTRRIGRGRPGVRPTAKAGAERTAAAIFLCACEHRTAKCQHPEAQRGVHVSVASPCPAILSAACPRLGRASAQSERAQPEATNARGSTPAHAPAGRIGRASKRRPAPQRFELAVRLGDSTTGPLAARASAAARRRLAGRDKGAARRARQAKPKKGGRPGHCGALHFGGSGKRWSGSGEHWSGHRPQRRALKRQRRALERQLQAMDRQRQALER